MAHSLERRTFLRMIAAGAAGGVACALAGARRSGAEKKPDVLLIMADDLNTALSGYGHPQCKTPNLDRLARSGMSFTRAFCQFPVCGPSRASLMTGRYPLSNGVRSNGRTLRGNPVTLPQLFRQNGYWTGRVSKIYHMGVPGNIYTGDNGTDHAPSWDERYNVSAMEALSPGRAEDVMLVDSVPRYEEWRKKWPAYRHKGGKLMVPGNHQGSDFVIVEADGGDEAMADGMAASKAVELLRQRAEAKKPFFLAVGFVRPHVPLVAPRDSFRGYDASKMKLAEAHEGDLADIPRAAQGNTNARKYKMDAERQKKTLRGYYASVSYMDRQVGRLLDELERLKLRANTIIVFASDHGYHLGEHTMWQKMSLMEESIRVPLIVSAPGRKSRNARCGRIVELVDIYPTLATLAGLKPPPGIQGQSFAKLLDDPQASHSRPDAFVDVRNGFCLRTERWAYMEYASTDKKTKRQRAIGTMLYDMQADPKQFTNLSGKPEHAEVEQGLRTRLHARIAVAKQS